MCRCRLLSNYKDAIDVQNLQVKLISNKRSFNQIDKRWIDKYAQMWNMPANVVNLLKYYTGEQQHDRMGTKDRRRLFATEFTEQEKTVVLNWLTNNKLLVVSDIIKGRGEFAAEWMMVIQKYANVDRWSLQPINVCLNLFGSGVVEVSKRGTFKIGLITMQRKGGDNGRDTANMLQFKIDPIEIFKI